MKPTAYHHLSACHNLQCKFCYKDDNRYRPDRNYFYYTRLASFPPDLYWRSNQTSHNKFRRAVYGKFQQSALSSDLMPKFCNE